MIDGITLLVEDEDSGDDVTEIPNIDVSVLRQEAEQNANGIAAVIVRAIDAAQEG